MIFIGSIDFYNGDFELKTIEANDIVEANSKLRRYIVTNYGLHIKEIDHIDIQSNSYLIRKLSETTK